MASAVNPTFFDRFLTFINPPAGVDGTADVDPAVPTLLTVSGGLDSVVMAHLFQNAGYRFAIAHVNFGLRGNESDDDARFVQHLAGRYSVPFYLTRFETNQFAADTGVSVQMAARTLRYDWFEQIRAEHQYGWIATAHHRNDVLETLLLNLTRGTGLAGLHGIAVRQGRLWRPLLFADRPELLAYATEHQLSWREDRSNADDHYARNRIRHHIVPVLQHINPNLLQTLESTLARLRAAETLVQHELDHSAGLVVKSTNEVTQFDLLSLHTLAEPAFRLAEWLRPFGYSYQQTMVIWQAIGQGRGQEFRSATHRLIHEQHYLTLSPLAGPVDRWAIDPVTLTDWPDSPVSLSGDRWLTFTAFNTPPDFVPPADPLIASFDADRLTLPIILRRWQAGDRFRPLGLNGQKLVSDLLADAQVPRLEREQTLVLLSGDQLAWVIGRRISHHFRITRHTRRVVQVQLLTSAKASV